MGPSNITILILLFEWSKHVVAITSEEEKKNCCIKRTHNALLIIHMQQEATQQ
jgi:hypothetical protein